MKKEKSQEKDQEQTTPALTVPEADFSSPFILKGKTLQVRINDHPIINAIEKKFKSEKELQELVMQNAKVLFGENIILLEGKKIISEFLEGYAVPTFLIDIKDMDKPKLYIVEVFHWKKTLGELFMRTTQIFSLLRNQTNRIKLSDAVAGCIDRSKSVKKELKGSSKNIIELLHVILHQKPAVLLVMDSERQELAGFMETYSEWEAIKTVVIRKFSSKGETIVTMSPDFDTVRSKGKKKTEKTQYTESEHLDDTIEDVKTIYETIKSELLKKDKTLQFNPQKYYISVRKNRNLAFFHMGRKRINLVVMNSDKDTRKQIKHHEVRTLTEKVQKFWNGASCTIVFENTKHLNEVISLLKKLVANA